MTLDEVAAYHEHLVTRLRDVLRGELVGVYAGGSFALGGYRPGRSDLDVAAVCREPLTRERKLELVEALRHEALPCPARGLELVLYGEASVRTPSVEPGYELDLNSGVSMPFRAALAPDEAASHWYAIDRAILREHGVALLGPPARELFAEIPRALLHPVLVDSVRWHLESGEALPEDAFANACRALRYADEGVWSSKPEAVLWANGRVASIEDVLERLR